MDDNEDKARQEIDRGFDLLLGNPQAEGAYEIMKNREREWKERDPVGYKKDMEDMCKEMFGERWEVEYQAMLREEFPEEF